MRKKIGMVFQRPNPFPKSIYDNIAWGAKKIGFKGKLDDMVKDILIKTGLWEEVKNQLHNSALSLSAG